MKLTTLLLLIFISISGCYSVQSKLDSAKEEIEYAEKNNDAMTAKDWARLENELQMLEIDLEQNRTKYNDEQVKEIGKIQGRYFAVVAKKGINDFQESLKDLGSQMEGFIEGITDSTNNKNK